MIDNENKIKTIELFDEDNYETNVKTIVDENYVIANYNQKYDFNEFYLIDVTNGKKDELIVNYDINFDSYVNGVYENSFFIFDNEEQFWNALLPTFFILPGKITSIRLVQS